MIKQAKWISSPTDTGAAAVILQTSFKTKKELRKATLSVSAMGLYNAFLNGKRVGTAVLTPGWTVYDRRIQYQSYDVTSLVLAENTLQIALGNGWAVGHIAWREKVYAKQTAAIAALELIYADGTKEAVLTSPDWDTYTSQVLYSDIYNGETVDRTAPVTSLGKAACTTVKSRLIPQVGEWITEQERITPVELITTPKGETVLDFGQNMTATSRFVCKLRAARASLCTLERFWTRKVISITKTIERLETRSFTFAAVRSTFSSHPSAFRASATHIWWNIPSTRSI